ncbi:uncharacterized protein LOC115632124 isoform X2 [Scaptodrosophila lebanonensis]|uniref:Uncharacterized protein LOC115632124 isoform X2 n=1 Tax=Drosophila lebanonensis TaxID=7225 RepID=A0A6J2U9G9_DROLE|nr:uncharacterized protein LOC115632124 isoform X2 [Scaptodrosophila lebanonensis]
MPLIDPLSCRDQICCAMHLMRSGFHGLALSLLSTARHWFLHFWHFCNGRQWFWPYRKQLRKLFNDNRYIFIGLFLIAAVLFTLFILIRALRHVLLINWLISILIVEFFILGAAVQAPRSHPIYMVSCIVIILLLFTVFILIASYMYCDLTEQVAALFLFCVVLLFVSLIMLMIFVLPRHWDTFHWDYHSRIAYYYFDVYRMILSLIVLMFVMYHAQLINGWRYAELRTKEGLLGSLILFSFFLIMYMLWCEPGFLVKPTVYFSYQIHDHKLKTTTARTTPAPHNTTLEST